MTNSKIADGFEIAEMLFGACDITRPWIMFREDVARDLTKPPHNWPLNLAYKLVADHMTAVHKIWHAGGTPEQAAAAVWEAQKNYADSFKSNKSFRELAISFKRNK